MTDRRIVITGIGVISPLGNDLASTWEAMKAGRSGIDTIKSMDVTGYSTKIAGEVKDFDPAPYFKTPKDARRVDRFTHFAMGAAGMALKDSGLDLEAEDKTRIGVMVGSGIGGLGTLESQHATLLSKGPARVSPFMIPYMISNIASGLISMEYGLGGPNMSIVTACATSNHNIGEAWRIMKFGDADVMVCGGAEATILPTGVAGFSNMKALSSRNDEPQRASRPYDVDRDGFVMGEGGGAIILETEEHARKRGAKILCSLAGYGNNTDGYHVTAPRPDGSGAVSCMQSALRKANMKPEDIGYINTHGTSTPVGDPVEVAAIKTLYGWEDKEQPMPEGLKSKIPPVSSTKGNTGHLMGAGGITEVIACVKAIETGILPPTLNYHTPDPACDLDFIPEGPRKTQITAAMSNALGFGGQNSSIIVKKYEAE